MKKKCINCENETISNRITSIRCKECQYKYHKQNQKDHYLKNKSNKKVLTTKEYLALNKPQLISFLTAYDEKRYDDIDIIYCSDFINYIDGRNIINIPHKEDLTLIEQMNYLIFKIIEEYSS